MLRTRISLQDIVILAVVLLSALLLLLLPLWLSPAGETLEVYLPEGFFSYDLAEDRTFTVSSNGHTLTVEIKDGSARVIDSTCPDGICRSGGGIDQSGESIICAPAGIRLAVVGKGGADDVDFVAG